MGNQPGAATPGFYPAENGRQRYWDGSQWTDRYADMETPPGPQNSNQPSPKKRSWFARHKILTGLGVLLLLFIVIGVANGGKSSTPTASPSVAASSATSSAAPSSAPKAPPSTSAPSTAPPAPSSTPAPPAAPAAPAETVSQQNAVKKAASYLQLTAFSRSGLIKQLGFDGFSTADATYGVDKSNTDWNEQAAKKAKDYLALTSFSRASLIKQLTFDGFTSQQAEYGAQKTGL